MRKTKIVCTIGPASQSHAMLKKIISGGMDVARLNFSHGTHEQHKKTIENIRKLSKDVKKDVTILQDLAGPKIRVGEIEAGVELKAGARFILTPENMIGNEKKAAINYPALASEVKAGDMILINDGLILLRIERTEASEVVCTVLIGGPLSSHKGVNVPSANLKMSALTQKDKEDLIFGLEHGVDIVSLSFVRCAEHVAEAKKFIADRGAELPVIAKIETQKALDNIDAIINEAYGIMVARGDLGVETPFETIPLIQESLIKKTNAKAKPVITATQVLTSMVNNSRPTRAEVTDVANAIIEGTDALMLSEETAIGNYPVESVKALARISEAIEAKISYERSTPRNEEGEKRISHAIARAACAIANDVEAVAIITPTRSGASARLVESHRPKQPIIAITPEMAVARRLNLSSGVYPFLSDAKLDIDNALSVAQKVAAHLAIWERDKPVVVTSGPRTGKMGKTDRIKVQRIA